jgi:hypothetical protein
MPSPNAKLTSTGFAQSASSASGGSWAKDNQNHEMSMIMSSKPPMPPEFHYTLLRSNCTARLR